ncbi:MAG: 30S ribosomal protein S6 [Candidatus Babeliaceae bacterium]
MNQINRYEILFLATPEITTDETGNLEGQFEKIVKGHQGVFLSNDRWGKYRLAYPIRKNDYGVYFLVRFEAAKENVKQLLKEIGDFFTIKNTDLIMRYLISRLDAHKSLEYQRPQSLEEAPTRDVDVFLKDNKMGRFGKDMDMAHSSESIFEEDRNLE